MEIGTKKDVLAKGLKKVMLKTVQLKEFKQFIKATLQKPPYPRSRRKQAVFQEGEVY